jgi:hypothetical protein
MPNRLIRAFTHHPASVDESYGEHFIFAGRFGLKLIGAGLAALLHGLLPFAFKTTASRTVQEMARRASTRAVRPAAQAATARPGTLDWSV